MVSYENTIRVYLQRLLRSESPRMLSCYLLVVENQGSLNSHILVYFSLLAYLIMFLFLNKHCLQQVLISYVSLHVFQLRRDAWVRAAQVFVNRRFAQIVSASCQLLIYLVPVFDNVQCVHFPWLHHDLRGHWSCAPG